MERKEKKPLPLPAKPWAFQMTLIFTVSYLLWGCSYYNRTANAGDVMSSSDSQKIVRLGSSPENFQHLYASSAAFKFYQVNDFAPVWMKDRINSTLADSMVQIIRGARLWGLLPKDYHLEEIEALERNRSSFNDNDYVSRMEMLLTDAFFKFTNHLRHGRVTPDSLVRHTSGVLSDSLQIALLTSALKRNELSRIFESQEPGYVHYRKLRNFLRKLLNNSDSTERQILLSGYALDSSVTSAKVTALEINLERWRWERELKGRYIYVNIPAYTLEVVEDDSVTMNSRVIVGSAKNQTPELDGIIRSFTIYPYWNVTRNIAVKEMLPQLKTDSMYLQSHNYEVLDVEGNVLDPSTIDWTQYHSNNFPFTLRQTQGIHNALGLIKFTFNNPYSVYLHDTNARLMFNREKRALSHGCVRVEKALELGRHLVRNDDIVSPSDLDQYLEMQNQVTVRIDPIPVHLRYYTCLPQGDSVLFLKDVYGRDAGVSDVLYKSPETLTIR
jgi:murein L,D-transpeptidase YcbB/YkuD